jgi:peptidoglycan/xylan/chitin deacetylase (PgdA/CDA1 family)
VLTEANFVALMQFIAEHFRTITIDEFLNPRTRSSDVPECLVTFDDGWDDNYTVAYPILRRMGIPGVIFVATGLVGSVGLFWVEQLRASCVDASVFEAVQQKVAPLIGNSPQSVTMDQAIEGLKRLPAERRRQILAEFLEQQQGPRSEVDSMLSWRNISEMGRDGIEIGSHTDTHPLLPYEENDCIRRELSVSKQKIEDCVGVSARVFAYPNGNWNPTVLEHVRETGYSAAFTTRSGWFQRGGDLYTVPRILLHDGNVTGWNGSFSAAVTSFTLTGWRA